LFLLFKYQCLALACNVLRTLDAMSESHKQKSAMGGAISATSHVIFCLHKDILKDGFFNRKRKVLRAAQKIFEAKELFCIAPNIV